MDDNHDKDDAEGEKPGYVDLAVPRSIGRTELPKEVAEFYMRHEGIGIESDPDRVIRLCRLDELARVSWEDLHLFGGSPPPHEGWASFDGFRLGYSDTLDELLYVLKAPGIPAGSVLAMGVNAMVGPAGSDVDGPNGSIVLAGSFDEWIGRLERFGSAAHGLFIDMDLPDEVAQVLFQRLAELNPHSEYAK
jgi:hypothetical protein